MPTGIQTYNLELHLPEPFVFDIDDDIEDEYDWHRQGQNHQNLETILVGYKEYDIKVIRNTYISNLNKQQIDKTYVQSWVEIYKGDLKLYDTYRFEPDEYHPDGILLTCLPLEVTTTKDPVTAEYKLLDKARAIIDRLDENGQAVLEMCNKGNILEMAA